MTSAIERYALRAWQEWGNAWAMFTACSRCGQVKACRGRSRKRMLCLQCYDESGA